jgi:hypothetical protein
MWPGRTDEEPVPILREPYSLGGFDERGDERGFEFIDPMYSELGLAQGSTRLGEDVIAAIGEPLRNEVLNRPSRERLFIHRAEDRKIFGRPNLFDRVDAQLLLLLQPERRATICIEVNCDDVFEPPIELRHSGVHLPKLSFPMGPRV